MRSRSRAAVAMTTAAVLSSLALAACGGSSDSTTSSGSSASTSGAASTGASTSASNASAKPVSMVLSNNFMGNEWRPQMVNAAKTVAQDPRFDGKISLDVKISDPTPAAQIASLQGIVRSKPDAVLIDAASPTALNPTINQACQAGITVITFDQYATADCAYKLPENYKPQGGDMARWLVAQLGGKGDVALDGGIAGAALSEQFAAAWKKEISSQPGMKVVGTYNSNFSDGPEEQGVSQLLSQNPNLAGVLSDYSCAAVISAFTKAGKKPKAVACNASNRSAIQCEKTKTPCFFYGAPSWVGGLAVEKAFKIVNQQIDQPKTEYFWETNYLSSDATDKFDAQQKVERLKAGVNYYPDKSPALIIPLSFGDYDLTAADVLGK